MKLYLHPGYGKCGSSTIQAFLKENVEILRAEKIGLVNQDLRLHPQGGLEWGNPGKYFKEILYVTRDLVKLKNSLLHLRTEAQKEGLTSVVLSEEFLCNNHCFNDGFKLHETIASVFDVTNVIFYIRRQDEFLISAWQQWGVKEGLSFEKYVQNSYGTPTPRPDYKMNILSYQKAYGIENVRVCILNKKVLYKGDLLLDFMSKLSLDATKFKIVENTNLGLHLGYSDILRRTPSCFDSIYDSKLKMFLNEYSTDSKNIIFSNRKPAIFYALSIEIMTYFKLDNQFIFDSFFTQYDFDDLFGLSKYADSQVEMSEVDELKEIISIQNDLILTIAR